VLYRSVLVEAGDVELVVKAPKHPYTQQLIASVPQVSTERTWLDERPGSQGAVATPSGCKFVSRCPLALPKCSEVAPQPRPTEPGREVACHVAAPV
jgi:oligopeptide/dipeptide ABC transporter ATP-binding protein